MPTALEDLVIKETSLVDRGANPGADIVFFKRADPGRVAKSDGPAWPASPSPEVIRNAMKALGAVVMSASADPVEKSLPVVMKAMSEFLDYVVPGAEIGKTATSEKRPRQPPAADEKSMNPELEEDVSEDADAGAEMGKVLDDMIKADPKLTRAAALAKVAESRDHAPLWKRYKTVGVGKTMPLERRTDVAPLGLMGKRAKETVDGVTRHEQ